MQEFRQLSGKFVGILVGKKEDLSIQNLDIAKD